MEFLPKDVNLYCGQHLYFGPGKDQKLAPTKGCKNCWQVYFFKDIAESSDPQKRLSELEEVIHHLVESVEAGTFDFKPFQQAEYEYTKEE